jgi:hypothetical protein
MGKGTKKTWSIAAGALALLFAAVVVFALVFRFVESASEKKEAAHRAGHPYPAADAPRTERGEASGGADESGAEVGGAPEYPGDVTGVDTGAEKIGEECQEEEDEKKVAAFDSLTDKRMKKKGGEVTMKDMDDFVAAFKSVPDSRKDECLHRALNLVSDDHVLLLAGILFDKSIDKEYLELVFNDVLNRDEEVKKLILPKIFKDKGHPCWADTAWILDVTGELPQKEESK